MKKIFTFIIMLVGSALFAQNAWINEIHYDNSSTDANEGVEIVIENPSSYTLSLFLLEFYNGNGGATYGTETVNNFIVGATD